VSRLSLWWEYHGFLGMAFIPLFSELVSEGAILLVNKIVSWLVKIFILVTQIVIQTDGKSVSHSVCLFVCLFAYLEDTKIK
jgi:hypothetical protein